MAFGFIFAGTFLAPQPVSAQTGANASACGESAGGFLNFPTWYKYLNPSLSDGECKLNFEFPDDIGKILLAVVEILLRVAGLVAVGFVIYGGFRYILTQGEPENAKKALTTIINALVGLVLAASATIIVNLIGNNLL